jgi:hypothetical protein
VRKPAIGNIKSERLKVILEGQHTLEEKICMLMQGIACLEHKHGIYRAGVCDLWLAPIDSHGYPLTALPEGQLIADYNLVIDSPYDCAADAYRA